MNPKIVFILLFSFSSFAQEVYSEEEQKEFAFRKIYPVVDMVMHAKTPYPDINQRIIEQDLLIGKRFGKKSVDINLHLGYNKLSRFVAAAVGVTNGQPRIVFYIPAIMNNYFDNQSHWITTTMHERYHLTERVVNSEGVNLELEIHIHGLTTKFVTVPLKEKHKVILSKNDQRFYDAWVRSGRSENSPIWRKFISDLHSPVSQKK